MRKFAFIIEIILFICVLFIMGSLFYHSYNVLSPGELLKAEGIEFQDLVVDEIAIEEKSEKFKLNNEDEILRILNEISEIRVKRDFLFEMKMTIFGSASRHKVDEKNGEVIQFRGISASTGLNVYILLLEGSYIDIEIYGIDDNVKTFSLYKIKGSYSYNK